MFLVSFASLSTQVVPAAGREGVTPVAKWFPRMRSDFGAPERYFYFPTLLWLNASDAMLRGLCFAGMAAALGVVYGGPFSFFCLLICYLAYLSLDLPMGLIFPWDCALFEASFFSLFLGPTLPLPSLEAVHPPEPAIAWMYRLLLFRVMFGFGKFKFLGATKQDRGYLKGFLINQPLPSYIGWYMQKLPMWMLKGALLTMFIAEIPVPLLLFFPGRASIIAGVAIFLLMIAIQACGSFGYFSMVMMVVCVTVFDSVTPRKLGLSTMFATPSAAVATTVVLLHTFGALINFPFNSWVSQRWFLWPHFLRARPRWLTLPLVFYRALYPFRCFHSYGVFFPGTGPGIKCVPVMELSWDGQKWIECPFKYATSLPSSPPEVRLAPSPSRRSGAHLRRLRRQWIDAGVDHHRLVQPLLIINLTPARAPAFTASSRAIRTSATSSTRARFPKIAARRSWGASASTCSSRRRWTNCAGRATTGSASTSVRTSRHFSGSKAFGIGPSPCPSSGIGTT